MTILIVEDNVEMRRYLGSLLRRLTTAIFESGNGREGVVRIRVAPARLGRDGHRDAGTGWFWRRPASLPNGIPKPGFLIVSNHSDPHVRAAASAAGACGFCGERKLARIARNVVLARAAGHSRAPQTGNSNKGVRMHHDENQDTTGYKVVVNHEEQYSIWPAARELPLGWREVGKQGPKDECLGLHQRSLDG